MTMRELRNAVVIFFLMGLDGEQIEQEGKIIIDKIIVRFDKYLIH